ncbi:hypothetical protein [Parabacteroides goldsteinii]
MSTQKRIIEVTPPLYQKVWEKMVLNGFSCPVCHGHGGSSEQVGFSEHKETECDYCQGAGKVKAEIQINWKPDYKVECEYDKR